MNIWFTADTHFGHLNVIKFCNRPFTSAEEDDLFKYMMVDLHNWL